MSARFDANFIFFSFDENSKNDSIVNWKFGFTKMFLGGVSICPWYDRGGDIGGDVGGWGGRRQKILQIPSLEFHPSN